MRAVLTILLLFISLLLVKGQRIEENTFQQSENAATGANGGALGGVGDEQVEGVGNPPGDEEIPIDNYLSTLALVGFLIIIYRYRYKVYKLY